MLIFRPALLVQMLASSALKETQARFRDDVGASEQIELSSRTLLKRCVSVYGAGDLRCTIVAYIARLAQCATTRCKCTCIHDSCFCAG